jgi:uncharacterized protein (TIGR03435 family)
LALRLGSDRWNPFHALGPREVQQNPDAFSPIETALQEQLGLKLEARKMRLDVVVVDSANACHRHLKPRRAALLRRSTP